MSDADADTKKTAPLVTKIDVTAHDERDNSADSQSSDVKSELESPGAVLITKRAMLKAPTVPAGGDDSALNGGNAAAPVAAPAAKRPAAPNIAPVIKPLTPVDAKPEADAKVADSAPTAEPAPTSAATPAEPKAEPTKTETETGGASEATESAGDGEKEAQKTEAELTAAAEVKAKHDEAIQKLVETKQYYVPINAVEKRKSKQFTVLGIVLSVLLLLAWADIALDAGLIQISGVKPVTHFFSN